MIVNLRNTPGNCTVSGNTKTISSNFLKQNKITINQVSQSHFTAQGVQSFTADEIKALKHNQDRNFQRKQGVFLQIKTYKVSDDLKIQQNLQDQAKQKKAKLMMTKKFNNISKIKNDQQNQTKQLVKPLKQNTAKQRFQMNNNVMSRLSKKMNKKQALQNKLHELSKKYKDIFGQKISNEKQQQQQNQSEQDQNDYQQKESKSKLCESLMSINKSINKQQSDQENEQIHRNKQKRLYNNKNKPSTAASSTKFKKKQNKSPSKILKEQQDFSQFQQGSQQQDEDKKEKNLVGKFMKNKNKSKYTQKLGSAVHLLFK